MALIKLSRIERHRMTVFLSCLVAAIITWLAIALSGRYLYSVESKISYVDAPDSKAFHPLQDDSVTLKIEGTGWQLLFSRLRLNPNNINVSLRALDSRNYVVFSNQLNELNSQFESSQRVISVSPDTLFFDFSKRTLKKVPVKLQSALTFKSSYGISGPIRISPSHVTINGAAEDLKLIKFWPTATLNRTNISSNVNARIGFSIAKANNIDVYPQTVKVNIPVDKLTEKVVEVPVKVLNGRGYDVKLLPERVKVTIITALSNYPPIDRDSFQAAVNLKEWQELRYKQLPVRLTKLPKYSKLIKIEPQVVDFFVKK